jgi:acid phosphatase type 7
MRHASWLLVALACSESPGRTDLVTRRLPSVGAVTGVLLAAGDIASCRSRGDEATAKLLDRLPGTVLTLGDNAYGRGTISDYAACYGPTWGRHLARTHPVPGNHEFTASPTAPYFAYFGSRAGPAGLGYYSFDVGGWHIVALNTNMDVSSGSAQVEWLRSDLAAHPARCTLAYGHYPRFSSGHHGSASSMQPIWQVLYDAGADVVLAAHDHDYERFAPQTPTGRADATRGIREFVAGTGGKSHYDFSTPLPNSEFRYNDAYGVLELQLTATGYGWSFLTTSGAVIDAGSDSCH